MAANVPTRPGKGPMPTNQGLLMQSIPVSCQPHARLSQSFGRTMLHIVPSTSPTSLPWRAAQWVCCFLLQDNGAAHPPLPSPVMSLRRCRVRFCLDLSVQETLEEKKLIQPGCSHTYPPHLHPNASFHSSDIVPCVFCILHFIKPQYVVGSFLG